MDGPSTNQLWASNLLRISALLIAVTYFVSPKETHFELVMISVIISMIVAVMLAYFVRKGYEGPRWILLALTMISMPFSVLGARDLLKFGLLYAVLSQVINLVQLMALILLFLPAKKNRQEEISEEME